ncbi:MAG: hypothetical protein ABSB35_36665 [Bryobacteraceae bacterium]|jgi:hypothetical protein
MLWLLITLLTSGVLATDLASIKTEPNLEKRSDLALDNAGTALDLARTAYNSGDVAKTGTALDEVVESVDLAYHSLEETGKDARRNPRPYKRAELKTRELLRRLEGIRELVSFEDRALVEKVRDRVAQVHDELLQGIMSKKK